MHFVAKAAVLAAAFGLVSTANAGDRVTVKLGETITHNGYELTVTKTGSKIVNIKKGKKDKRGEYERMSLDFSIKNVNAEGINIFYTGNEDPRLEEAVTVAGVNVVNAQRALNMRPGLTTSSSFAPNHRAFAYTYKDTNAEGEEVSKTIDFRVGTYFLPGDSTSTAFNAWLKKGEEPEISFEIHAK